MRNDLAVQTICEHLNTNVNKKDRKLRSDLLEVIIRLVLQDRKKVPDKFTEKVMKKIKKGDLKT